MADLKITVDFNDLLKANSATIRLNNSLRGLSGSQRSNVSSQSVMNRSVQSATQQIQNYHATTNRATVGTRQFAGAAQQSARHINRSGVLTQQAGYQIGDFLVQVQSGTNAFVAFGQQATQVAGTLTLLGGKWVAIGSALGVAIPLFTALGATLSRTGAGGQVFDELVKSLGPVAPILESVAKSIRFLKETAIDGVNVLVNNLDRLLVTAGTVASFFAAKFVAGFVAARLATLTFAGALTFLRGALIRTGIGALIVGAGELVYQFTRLAQGAGGFGEAVSLMGAVVLEVWDRIKMGASSAGASATALFFGIKADAATATASAIESVVSFGNTAANTFEGAFLAIKEVWSRLPNIIGDVAYSAANRLIEGVEAMLNAAIRRIDSFTGRIRDALASVGIDTAFGEIGQIELGGVENPFAGSTSGLGTAISDAFSGAFSDNPLSVPDLGLDAVANEALAAANLYRQAAADLAAGATTPLKSLEDLRAALANLDDSGRNIDIRDWFGGAEEGGEGSVDRVLTDMENRIQSIADTLKSSMSDAFMSMVDGTKTVRDAFRDMARSIIKQLYDVLVVQQLVGSFDVASGTGSGIVGAISKALFRESGGSMMPNQPYIVGERGPELVIPGRSATITNADLTRKSVGSESIVVNNNINVTGGTDPAAIRMEVAKLMPTITNATKTAVIDARRRGGQMKAAFQ